MKTLVNHRFSGNLVYCKKSDLIREMIFDDCHSCEYFNGTNNGRGVECRWEDEDDRGNDVAVYSLPDLQNRVHGETVEEFIEEEEENN